MSGRVGEVSTSQRHMLGEIARAISDRLEIEIVALPNAGADRIGLALREGERNVVIEMPLAAIVQATSDPIGRETLRTRIKGRRDRMMFRVPPPGLPKKIAPLFSPGPSRAGYRGGRR